MNYAMLHTVRPGYYTEVSTTHKSANQAVAHARRHPSMATVLLWTHLPVGCSKSPQRPLLTVMQFRCLKCKLRESRSPRTCIGLLLSSFVCKNRFVGRAQVLMHSPLWVYAPGRCSVAHLVCPLSAKSFEVDFPLLTLWSTETTTTTT